MERSLLIRGELNDLSDLLRIARAIGKKVLNVDRVNVKPDVMRIKEGYVVVVSPENNGDKLSPKNNGVFFSAESYGDKNNGAKACSKSLDVERGKKPCKNANPN